MGASGIDQVSHSLGRLEGKLDLMLANFAAMEKREALRADAIACHDRRIKALELMAAKVAGISMVLSAVVGFAASLVRASLP